MRTTTVTRENYPVRFPADALPVELSVDQATPLAFSKAPLFRPAPYVLTAEIRSNRRLGEYVLYRIMKRSAQNTYSELVYESACYDDALDIWTIFA